MRCTGRAPRGECFVSGEGVRYGTMEEEVFRPDGHQLGCDQLWLVVETEAEETGQLEMVAAVEEEPEMDAGRPEVGAVVEEEPEVEDCRPEVGD